MTVPSDPRVASDVLAEQARAAEQSDGLDGFTKDQLLTEAEQRGVEVKASASKAEVLAAVRAAPPAAEESEPEGE
jgi:hypothetical protein